MIENPIVHWQGSDILIVDDNAANLRLLTDILNAEGYSVRPVTGGELALRSIKTKMPSVILLDVLMPEMDGFEVCRRLKADKCTSDIPVIFISALDDKHSMLTGFELGGVDFISKPFRKEEVLARVKAHIRLFQLQADLKAKNEKLEDEIIKRKQAELAIEKRMIALTQPLDDSITIDFNELFNIAELQQLQDQFADAFGVASILTQPDGTPITKPSNFSHLCQNIIRCTEKGRLNCMHSDAVIGRHNADGPIVQLCLSGGLWDAGASITVGGNHVANWLIGQVRSEVQKDGKMEEYAREIGANETDFMKAFHEIPSMSLTQFQKISEVLFTLAGQLSAMAYQNVQQARFIGEKKWTEAALLDSEERFRTTLYSIGDGVITTDSEGKVGLMNPVAEQLTGWSQSDAVGKILEEVFPIINEATRAQVEIPVRKVLREGRIVGLANHTLLIAKDGTERPISDSGAPIRNKKDEITGVVLVFRDQTVERENENTLRESEFFFRESQRAAFIGSYNYNLVTGFWDSSEVLDQIFGIDKEYVRSVDGWKDLIYQDDLEMMTRHLSEEVIGEQKPFNKEYRIVRKSDGEIRWVNGLGKLNLDAQGNILSLIGTIQDITTRRRTEEVLEENEENFRNIFEHSPIGISMTGLDGSLHVNRAFCEMLGYTEAELKEKKWIDVSHPGDTQKTNEFVHDLLEGKINDARFEKRYIHKNGSTIWADVSTFLQWDDGGNSKYFITSVNNITKRKEVEESLHRNEQKFRALIENSSDAISLVDSNGLEIYHSLSCQHILGYSDEERKGKNIMELIHPDDLAALMDLFGKLLQQAGTVNIPPTRIHHLDGSWLWIEGIANNLLADPDIQAIVINFRDITQRKQSEDLLVESEEKFRKLADSTPITICVYQDENWVYTNRAGEKLSGYSFDEFCHLKIWEFVAPEYQELVKESARARLAGSGYAEGYELKILTRSGEEKWVYLKGSLISYLGKPAGLISVLDISQRKESEKLLRDSEEKFRTLVASSSDGISLIDLQGNILFVNQRKVEMVKANSVADLVGINANTLLTPFYQEVMRGLTEQFAKDGYLRNIEAEVKCFDGSTFWAEFNFTLVSDLHGNPSYIMDSMRDVTERKQAEKAILDEKKLLRTLIDNLPVTVYVKDREARKMVANTLDLATIGIMDETKVLGKTDLELFDNEIGQRGYDDDMEVIRTGKPVLNREEFFITEKGEKRWLLTSKVPLLGENGKPNGLVGVGRDITDQKNSEVQIRKLSESIEQSPSTIVITDIHGAIEYVNPKFCEITGYSKEEAIGQNSRILKSGEMPVEIYMQLWEVISSGNVWRGEFLNRKKNGALYWEWATMTSIKNELGEITNYIAIKEDISLRKQMEADLIIAKDKAEESDRLKSAFLANMSHEIRTPLNSIIGFSELLADSDFEEEQKDEFIQHIITNGNNLLNIISDIMDISKMESGELKIYVKQINAQKFITNVKDQFALHFDRKSIQFKINHPETPDEIFVFADPDRLKQIFNNLISNALKFTTEGYVQIGYESKGDTILFSVKDTGIGIPVEYHEKIFERFRQVEESKNRKFGGNGLGLAITRNLINQMGGKIWLESESGKGSSFYFTLPKQIEA